MAITSEQDIPSRPKPTEPWTFRKLLSGTAVISTLAKVFVNPLDVLFAFSVVVMAALEFMERRASDSFLFLTALLFVAVIFERNKELFFGTKV